MRACVGASIEPYVQADIFMIKAIHLDTFVVCGFFPCRFSGTKSKKCTSLFLKGTKALI